MAWSVEGRSLTVAGGAAVERIEPGRPGAPQRVRIAGGAEVSAPLVVLCAGALATPAILWRSGLDDRPVGRALRDHPSFAVTLVLRHGSVGAGPPPVEHRAVSTLVRWSSEPDRPGDLQAIVLDRVDDGTGPALAVVAVGLMAVDGTGSVAPAAGPAPPAPIRDGGVGDPGDVAPAATSGPVGPLGLDVVTGSLEDPADRRRLRTGVRRLARWIRTPPLTDLVAEAHVDESGTPLSIVDDLDDAELDALIAARPGPYAHPAGTCPMGPPAWPSTVTSCEPGRAGELIGRPGVRVADASVFPDLVRGGLQLPVAAVAARIADDIVSGDRA